MPECKRDDDDCFEKNEILKDAKQLCDGRQRCLLSGITSVIKCMKYRGKINAEFVCQESKTTEKPREDNSEPLPIVKKDETSVTKITTLVTHRVILNTSSKMNISYTIKTKSSKTYSVNITKEVKRHSLGTAKKTKTVLNETRLDIKNFTVTKENDTKVNISERCINSNGSLKIDGNYEWPENPACYIQCVKGKANWQCCKQKDFVYVDRCGSCSSHKNKTNCNSIEQNKSTITISTKPPVVILTTNHTTTKQYKPVQTTVNTKPILTSTVSHSSSVNNTDHTKAKSEKAIVKLLNYVKNIPKNSSLAANITSQLKSILHSSTQPIQSQDVEIVNSIVRKVTEFVQPTVGVADDVLETYDFLLASNNSINKEDATLILQQIDELGNKIDLPKEKNEATFSKSNLRMEIHRNKNKDIFFYSPNIPENLKIIDSMTEFYNTSQNGSTVESFAKIPSSALLNIEENTNVYFIDYLNTNLFRSNYKLASNVISINVGKNKIENLNEPIEIIFKLSKEVKDYENISCAYWENKLGNHSNGLWLTNGCHTVTNNNRLVKCYCNHLTSFGLIMNFDIIIDPTQRADGNDGLKLISFIGCFLSIFGLGLTLITFLCFERLRSKVPSKILICLCLSLLLLMIVFVAGVTETKYSSVCHITACLLHYFTLTTFCWMGVEGINLYRSVVKVFTRGNDNRFFRWMFINAWGIPLVIAGLTGFFTRHLYHPGHGNAIRKKLCIVTGLPFYFGLLLPVAIVMLCNFIIFIPVIRGLAKKGKLVKDTIQERQSLSLKRAKASLSVLVLLGISWIFALLALGKLRLIFQWLFCIFTTFQGLLIFLLFVVFNTEANMAWKALCCGVKNVDYHLNPYNGSSTMKEYNEFSLTEASLLRKDEKANSIVEQRVELNSFAN